MSLSFALAMVSFVTELTKHIKVKGTTSEEDCEKLSTFFPVFIWAVRDFMLELKHEGQKITMDEYLEKALVPKEGKPCQLLVAIISTL